MVNGIWTILPHELNKGLSFFIGSTWNTWREPKDKYAETYEYNNEDNNPIILSDNKIHFQFPHRHFVPKRI